MTTPVTPLMVAATSVAQFQAAGYETYIILATPDDLGVNKFASRGRVNAIIDTWEPERPAGDDWVLAHKGWYTGGNDADIAAIWARQAQPRNAAK